MLLGQYPGLCGLFVSGIFSASLSTVSSAVSSLAAVTIEDYIKPLYKMASKRSMTDTDTTLSSKVMAAVYGLLCVALAFGVGSLGGVLQASLTIFGVIGGPLLAIFSLGMFTVRANQKGVLIGLLIGLVFSFVIGFGGNKPIPPKLPLSKDSCALQESQYKVTNATLISETTFFDVNTTEMKDFTTTRNSDSFVQSLKLTVEKREEHKFYWLYRVSYLWYSVIGFIVTFTMGYIWSILLEKFGWANNNQIYTDPTNKVIDPDLFVPPLARKLYRRAITISEEVDKLNGLQNGKYRLTRAYNL